MANIEEYTSLLSPGKQWGELAGQFIGGYKSDKKKAKGILAGMLALNLWESGKINKVIKNLKQNEVDKTFQQSGTTQLWDKLSQLIGVEKEANKDPNYWLTQAEVDWNKLNPNFDARYPNREESQVRKRAEIQSHSVKIKGLHDEKIKTGKIMDADLRLTKEVFMKPFDDYYRTKQDRIADPMERSAVHQVLGFVGVGRRDRARLDETLKDQRKAMQGRHTRFEYLLDPDELEKGLTRYRRKDEFGYTKDEAKKALLSKGLVSMQDDITRQTVFNSIDTFNFTTEDGKILRTIPESALESMVQVHIVGLDKIDATAKIAVEEYDKKWKLANPDFESMIVNKDTGKNYKLPRVPYAHLLGDKQYAAYSEGRQLAIDVGLGIFSEADLALRRALIGRRREEAKGKENQSKSLLAHYNKVILGSTLSQVDVLALSSLAALKTDEQKWEGIQALIFENRFDPQPDDVFEGVYKYETQSDFEVQWLTTYKEIAKKYFDTAD